MLSRHIQFVSRTFCLKILAKNSELSGMKKEILTEIGLSETVELIVWPNLSPHDEDISHNCRELRRKGHIYSVWFYSGSVFIKKYWTGEEESIKIHHLKQLAWLFQDFKFIFQEDIVGIPVWKLSSELFNNFWGYSLSSELFNNPWGYLLLNFSFEYGGSYIFNFLFTE